MAQNIKIFVIGHKAFEVPKSELLVPIQAGSDINDVIRGLLHDNAGDNISAKNKFYCELTAQYYAVKNEEADYYGFFHYRRYLNFSEKTSKKPYIYYDGAIENLGDFINLGEAKAVISEYDLLLPRPENFYKTPYDHYAKSPQHEWKNALDNVLEIVKDFYPEMSGDIEDYVYKSTEHFFGNMYIMKKSLANEYLDFLMKIFIEFDKRYNDVPVRTQGFLAERLFGIFFYHKRRDESFKYKYLQRVDVLHYFGKKTVRKIAYKLLPPSSRIRAFAKNIIKTPM